MDDSSEEEEDRYLLLLEDTCLSFQYPAVFTVMTAVLAAVTEMEVEDEDDDRTSVDETILCHFFVRIKNLYFVLSRIYICRICTKVSLSRKKRQPNLVFFDRLEVPGQKKDKKIWPDRV